MTPVAASTVNRNPSFDWTMTSVLPFGVASIETVRGAGYRLRADGGRA